MTAECTFLTYFRFFEPTLILAANYFIIRPNARISLEYSSICSESISDR
jgi:hypothetical protein